MKKISQKIRFYKVQIKKLTAFIEVRELKQSGDYVCLFVNDDQNDFINSFKSFGFKVRKNPQGELRYKVYGSFTIIDADNIWKQIDKKYSEPFKTQTISIQ